MDFLVVSLHQALALALLLPDPELYQVFMAVHLFRLWKKATTTSEVDGQVTNQPGNPWRSQTITSLLIQLRHQMRTGHCYLREKSNHLWRDNHNLPSNRKRKKRKKVPLCL